MQLELTEHQAETLRDELNNRIRALRSMEASKQPGWNSFPEIQGRISFLLALIRQIDLSLTPGKEPQ
jgi:hypothetical protein